MQAIEVIGSMTDADGYKLTFRADCDNGVIIQSAGSTAVRLEAGQRDDFARLYMEACRRADGEPPAVVSGGHPLVESALAIARAEQEAVDRDE